MEQDLIKFLIHYNTTRKPKRKIKKEAKPNDLLFLQPTKTTLKRRL